MRLIFLAILFVVNSSFTYHKFYMSNTLIEYNPASQMFEITIKTFTDDLQRAAQNEISGTLMLEPGKEDLKTEDELCKFFSTHFKMSIDQTFKEPGCVGYESEIDLTYFYMEIPWGREFSSVNIYSDIFTDLFEDQKNVVELSGNGIQKTIVLTRDHTEETILRH